VVLLSSPRATLGQRKSLINSITQISKPPVQWQNHTNTLQWQKNSTHQGRGLTPRMVWAVGLFPGSFQDVRIRRTRMPVGWTSLSTQLGERLERLADVPSRRRRQRPRRNSTALRLALQPLLRDSVGTTPIPADGPGSRPRLGEQIV